MSILEDGVGQASRDPKDCPGEGARLNSPVPAPLVMALHRFIHEVATQKQEDY